jgi:serine/threonine-protein kinase greatwall
MKEIKRHSFFKGIEWEELRSAPAPFVPDPSNQEDTSYFESKFELKA